MPFRQSHRGKHPEDEKLFSEKWVPALQQAVADLSLLMTRGYAETSALKLVGDRYRLTARQRRGVLAASCSDDARLRRAAHAVPAEQLQGRAISLDGYNILITTESALANGVLLRGRDGCIRDMASIHGSYRKVEETCPAIHLLGAVLRRLGVTHAHWYFDAPVSNSGRLRALFYEEARKTGWNWRIDVVANPDKVLATATDIVATSDGWILNRTERWTPLMEAVLEEIRPRRDVINLGCG